MGFGPDITNKFLKENNLGKIIIYVDLLIRSHEVKQEGYEEAHNGKCITIFSAPNYCDQMGNKGAFIRLKGKDMVPKYTKFVAVVTFIYYIASSKYWPNGICKKLWWTLLIVDFKLFSTFIYEF